MVSHFKMHNLIHSMEACKQSGTPFYPFDKEEIKAMLAMPSQALLDRLPVHSVKNKEEVAFINSKSEALHFLAENKERYGLMKGTHQNIVILKEAQYAP